MIKCPKCGVDKEQGKFSKSSVTKSGFRNHCKACESKRYFENKEKIQKWQQGYYERNKEKIQTRNKKFYQDNLEEQRAKSRAKQWEKHLKYRYGLTVEKYDEMVKKVEGKCEICGVKPKKLRVDHCHKKGHVRGLLCDSCNYHLPIVENELLLKNAQDYLRKGT